MKNYIYKDVKVLKVIDGDTFDFRIKMDVGFQISVEKDIRIRLANYNAPERNTPEGKEITHFVNWIFANYPFHIETYKTSKYQTKDKKGKYGRYIAAVYIGGANRLLSVMIDEELKKIRGRKTAIDSKVVKR